MGDARDRRVRGPPAARRVCVGAGTVGRVYRVLCAVALVTFLVASAAVVQARLYQVGHDRDPNSPLRGLHNFTPPLVGPAKVGNFTVWSFPHAGAVMLLAAAGLAVYGVRLKQDATDDAGNRRQPDEAMDSGRARRRRPDPVTDSCRVRRQPDRLGKAAV